MHDSASPFTLRSPAFAHEERIPNKYTCDGENTSPPLAIFGVPNGTQSFVLLVEDPDIPEYVAERIGNDTFDHWVLFNIPVVATTLGEGTVSNGTQGNNSRGEPCYTGPCPPEGEHRYLFKLYALDTVLNLPIGTTKEEVTDAMTGHILESTTLMGRYARE